MQVSCERKVAASADMVVVYVQWGDARHLQPLPVFLCQIQPVAGRWIRHHVVDWTSHEHAS